MRHPGTPESVGRGVAAGLFAAFVIPAGHMLLALLLALLVRGAKGAAVLSTWVINPFTASVVYPVQCYLGSFIMGDLLSYPEIRHLVADIRAEPSWRALCALGGELIASFFAGGVLLGSLVAVGGYFCTTVLVRRYRARRILRNEFRRGVQETKEL